MFPTIKKALILFLLATLTFFAQEPVIEYGKPEELKAIKKVYIFTGTQIEVRQNIVKEISKKLPNLEVVEKPEDAEVMLIFAADSKTFLSRIQTTSNDTSAVTTSSSTPIYRSIVSASGLVIKAIGPGRVRLLMDFKDSRGNIFERRPSTNFAKEFVKIYLKVKGRRK